MRGLVLGLTGCIGIGQGTSEGEAERIDAPTTGDVIETGSTDPTDATDPAEPTGSTTSDPSTTIDSAVDGSWPTAADCVGSFVSDVTELPTYSLGLAVCPGEVHRFAFAQDFGFVWFDVVAEPCDALQVVFQNPGGGGAYGDGCGSGGSPQGVVGGAVEVRNESADVVVPYDLQLYQ